VLNNIPFAIPFDVRVSIFRNFVFNDAMQHSGYASTSQRPINPMAWLRSGQSGAGKTRVHVRRGNVAEDGFDKLVDADLKGPVEITFIDQFGAEE
jgi:ubiquitin-protein ligase E3 C